VRESSRVFCCPRALARLQLAIEAIHLTFAVNQTLLLTGEEWMALRANFGADDLSGRTGRPGITTSANNLRIGVIFGMRTLFHAKTFPSQE
jgi:hypothetical protein